MDALLTLGTWLVAGMGLLLMITGLAFWILVGSWIIGAGKEKRRAEALRRDYQDRNW